MIYKLIYHDIHMKFIGNFCSDNVLYVHSPNVHLNQPNPTQGSS